MTIDEAKASLKALCHTCKHFPTCVNDKPECFQAIEMAIKSLETIQRIDDVLNVEGITEIDALDEIMEAVSEFKYDCGVDE